MNINEFAKYMAETFELPLNAAKAIVSICSSNIYNAIVEGNTIDIDNLGKFEMRNIRNRKIFSPKKQLIPSAKEYKRLYFKPSDNLKVFGIS